MKTSLAIHAIAVALFGAAMFAPANASAQVNIYVGPGGYSHYGYGIMGIRVMDTTPTTTTATVIPITDTVTATILATPTATTVTGDATLDATGAGGIIS